MSSKLLFAVASVSALLLASCTHGYVAAGVREDSRYDGRYYGHHEFVNRRPVIVEQRPVIIHENERDGDRRDFRSANDRW